MQAEEDVITVDRVHTIGIFEEKLLLLGVRRSLEVKRSSWVGYREQAMLYLDVGYP